MGILDELTSATGDKSSNAKLVDRCLETPVLLHTVAEGLRTGTPKVAADCATIVDEVAKKQPELLADFASDLFDMTHHKRKPIVKKGFACLARAAYHAPAEVYAQRDYLLEQARAGGPTGLAAAAVLASLCDKSPNYRGKLLGHTLRLLQPVKDQDLPKWAAAIAPATGGSADAIKKLRTSLEPRREGLEDAANSKLDKLLARLERAAGRKQ